MKEQQDNYYNDDNLHIKQVKKNILDFMQKLDVDQ